MSNGNSGNGPLDVIGTGLDVVKGAVELSDGNITRTFDRQTKRAEKLPDCRCDDLEIARQIFRVIKFVHFTGLYDLVRIRLGVRWQYNGCDVIGAIPYLGSSVARIGWSADVEVRAIDTDTTANAACECCERSVCVAFQYTVTIDPLVQATRTRSGEILVCGDGFSDHTTYN
ncbi:MAG: hypothetical protein R3362_13400 [Rhodothermales bacterium]|nr:hypothetical protein [Rhodothermales bacterium]